MNPILKLCGILLFSVLTMCCIPRSYAHDGINAKWALPARAGAPAIKGLAAAAGKQGSVFPLQVRMAKNGSQYYTTVYAALEWEFAEIFETDYSYSEHWNYYVRFYSDAAGTTPLSLPNDITLNLRWSEDFTGGYQYTNESDLVLQGATEYVTGDVETVYYDPTFSRTVSVDIAPGSGYIALN